MNSCEPSRTAAYGLDIRWRMVYQRVYLELSFKATIVRRTLDLFMLTGDVTKRPYPEQHGCKLRRLTEDDQLFILNLVLERPGIYLHKLKHELLVSKATQASMATICRFLHSCSFSRTRIRSIALQRDEEQRAKYVAEVALYAPNMFVFVDETGNDRRDGIRKCGYALRGKRCVATRLQEASVLEHLH